ncbi:MAG: family 16 glycosylhydrolase [Gammaproteobacteria bacterium]|nr:family 16 glycosylhydrolase [Gammaproteobacteria bacterium]
MFNFLRRRAAPDFDADFADLARNEALADAWHYAHGWANGPPFANRWSADQAAGSTQGLRLELAVRDALDGDASDVVSAEVRSNAPCGYGRFESRFRAARADGVVTSLFVYTGPSEGTVHDEIDIEILGCDPTHVHFNYFRNGVESEPRRVALGFDASAGFHTYAFEWRRGQIDWFVDNKRHHSARGTGVPRTPGRVMMNLWAVDETAYGWAGAFDASALPVHAHYQYARYRAF